MCVFSPFVCLFRHINMAVTLGFALKQSGSPDQANSGTVCFW